MPEYVVEVNATSNGTLNTEDTFVEIDGFHKVRKVIVRLGDGTESAGVDNNYRVRIVTKTVLGSGITAGGTENPHKHGDDRAAGIVTAVKSGTNNFSLGTLGRVLEQAVRNGRETYIWEPPEGYTTTRDLADGRAFGVMVQNEQVSIPFQVTVIYEE